VTCWKWYQGAYLDGHILRAYISLIVPVVRGIPDSSQDPCARSKRLCYDVLAKLVDYLEDRAELTLLNMVTRLMEAELLKNCSQNLAAQLVFQMVGWLCALWEPILDSGTIELRLRRTGRLPRRRGPPKPVNLSANLNESRSTLFHRFLHRSGSLLPEPRSVLRDAFRGDAEAGPETISATYLSLHNLQQDLDVKLEWTSTMSQHLEFDRRNCVLFVFRFPSICRLLYRDQDGSVLSQIYQEWSKEYEKDPNSRFRNAFRDICIEDYFVEVLMSYYWIFGRSGNSRASGRRLLVEAAEREKWKDGGLYDPLLEILCTKSAKCPEVQELLNDLQANDRDYISVDDYPFLGKRLAALHTLSIRQHPTSWRRLWNDRRNRGAWLALWAVMVFGGISILLQLLQLIIQGFQTWPRT
jgi:hypothetical protein